MVKSYFGALVLALGPNPVCLVKKYETNKHDKSVACFDFWQQPLFCASQLFNFKFFVCIFTPRSTKRKKEIFEASSLDQINMTKIWLEHDGKFLHR